MTFTNDDIQQCAGAVRAGGLILYPTDTVWGIGCDARRSDAVQRIYDLKQRTQSKALITLVDSVEMLRRYVDDVPEVALQLIEAAVEPVTIVYDHALRVAPNLCAPDGSLAVRVTADPFCRALIRSCRVPLVSTSANVSDTPAPTCFAAIDSRIVEGVDCVASWRRDEDPQPGRKPSTVIRLHSDGQFQILRK